MTRRAVPLVGAGTVLALLAPATAAAHGDEVAISELSTAWSSAPAVLAATGLGLILFGQAFVRLRSRGRRDHAPAGRAALFALALSLFALALLSPLDAAGEQYLLSAHMLQHVVIGDLAPALALVALRGPLAFFLLPPAALRPLARLGALRSALRFLLKPKVSLAFWGAVVASWHVPAAYDAVLSRPALHDLEHGSFVLAGFLVWSQLVDPARRGELRVGGRIFLAVVLFACGQVLADVLLFSFHPLYPAYAAQDERLLGLSALTDQKLAGAVMMAEQLLTLGTCAFFLGRQALRERGAGRVAHDPS